MSTPKTPVLMSADNPEGWKLEELVEQIRLELYVKNDRIGSDPSQAAKAVRANNLQIVDLLAVIECRQRDTLTRLDEIRSDAGPGGTPRIGTAASPPPAAPAPESATPLL